MNDHFIHDLKECHLKIKILLEELTLQEDTTDEIKMLKDEAQKIIRLCESHEHD